MTIPGSRSIFFSNSDTLIFRCPDFVVSALEETVKNCIQTDGIQATRLCTHKEDVDFINRHELNNLKGKKEGRNVKNCTKQCVYVFHNLAM